MMLKTTADLVDEFGDRIASCDTQLRQFGARRHFAGTIQTIHCYHDNGLVKAALAEPGQGKVLVVDAGESLHTAMLGDMIATAAAANGWEGVVINGVVRDCAALATIDLGIKALGTNPRKSAKDSIGELDVIVRFGKVAFEPGRLLVADDDGVVVLPADADPGAVVAP